MVLTECAKCTNLVDSEEMWIADEGILCRGCCQSIYGNSRIPEDSGHYHIWEKYIGFTHVYYICVCGEKRVV